MGFPDGSVVFKLTQDFITRQRRPGGEKFEGKGKGARREAWRVKVDASALDPDWSEERKARATEIMVERGTMGEAIEWIVGRIRSEEPAEDGDGTTMIGMFDVNGLLWGQFDYARKLIKHNRSRLSIDLDVATRRIELFIILEAAKGWKKEFEGLEELELFVDHKDKRDWGKLFAMTHRMDSRAKLYAEALYRHEEDDKGEGESTRRGRQKGRKETEQGGKTNSNAGEGMVVGDEDVEEQKKIEEKERKRLKRSTELERMISADDRITPGARLPDDNDFNHTDSIIRQLALELRSIAVLTTASRECDDAIVAVCRGANEDDNRIETVSKPGNAPFSSASSTISEEDDIYAPVDPNAPASPASPSSPSSPFHTSANGSKTTRIVLSPDCDFIYSLTSEEARAVVQPFKRNKKRLARSFDLQAIAELPIELWPYKGALAMALIAVLVSEEKGGKVGGLTIVGALHKVNINRMVNHAEELQDAIQRLNQKQGPVSLAAFGAKKEYSTVDQLEEDYLNAFRQDGISRDAVPLTLREALKYAGGMREARSEEDEPISKTQVLRDLVLKRVAVKEEEVEVSKDLKRSHSHVPIGPSSAQDIARRNGEFGRRIKLKDRLRNPSPTVSRLLSTDLRSSSWTDEPHPDAASFPIRTCRAIPANPFPFFASTLSQSTPVTPSPLRSGFVPFASTSFMIDDHSLSTASSTQNSSQSSTLKPRLHQYGVRQYQEKSPMSNRWDEMAEQGIRAIEEESVEGIQIRTKLNAQKQRDWMKEKGKSVTGLEDGELAESFNKRIDQEAKARVKKARAESEVKRGEERADKQKKKATDGKKEREVKTLADVKGVGIKSSFEMRCHGEFPIGAVLQDLRIKKELDENGVNIPETDQEWEELPPGDWKHSCREFLKILGVVGREAVYSMAKYVETAARISMVYEPGYLKNLNEKTAWTPQVAEALLASFKEEDLYGTPIGMAVATAEEIDSYLEEYSEQSLRFGWSLPEHRDKMKGLLLNIGIQTRELENWKRKWGNEKICFGILVVTKLVKDSKHDHPPSISNAQFYGSNLRVLGTNTVVFARVAGTTWSSRTAKLILEKSSSFLEDWHQLPFQREGDVSPFDSVPTSYTTTAILANLAEGHGKNKTYRGIQDVLRQHLETIVAKKDPHLDDVDESLTGLKEQLIPLLKLTGVDVMLIPELYHAENFNFEDGVDQAADVLVLVVKWIRLLGARGLQQQVELRRARDDTKAVEESEKFAKLSIGDLENLAGEKKGGKGKKKYGEKEEVEDDGMEGTVAGGFGAEELRLYAVHWSSWHGRTMLNFNPQGLWLDSASLAYFSRPKARGSHNELLRAAERYVERTCEGVRQMNAECFNEEVEISSHQDEEMQEREDGNGIEGERDRIGDTAENFKSKMSGDRYRANKTTEETRGGGGGGGGGGALSSSTPSASNDPFFTPNPLATPWNPSSSPASQLRSDDHLPLALDETTAVRESEEQPMEEVIFNSNPQVPPSSNQHLPDLHRPMFTKEGVAFEAFKERYHRETSERGGGTKPKKIMIPGVHDLSLFKIVDGPGEVYAVERRQAGFDDLKLAQEKVYKIFSAPFENGLTHTKLESLVEQSGSDFVRAMFKLDIGPKLPFDRFYLKDDLLQFFTLDPRRAQVSVHYAMEKAELDTKRSWSNLFPEFMSLKSKTRADGSRRTPKDIDDGPDLLDCYEKARFERIGVRVNERRDAYVKRGKGVEERKAAERGRPTRPTYRGFEGTFETRMIGGKRVLKWRNEKRWAGYRQGPLEFSDDSILVQPTRALPEDASPKSRSVRAVKEAKEAIGGGRDSAKIHTLCGLDPGETYLSYGYSTQRGSSKSTCVSVKKGVNKERDEITKGVGKRLREGATGAELVKARHGRKGATVAATFGRDRTTLESIGQDLPDAQATTSSQGGGGSQGRITNEILPFDWFSLAPALQCQVLGVEAPILQRFKNHDRRYRKKVNDSQADLAVKKSIPRMKRSHFNKKKGRWVRRFRKQTAGLFIGAGGYDSKSLGTGRGTEMVEGFVNRLRARPDVRDKRNRVCEDYTSQLCPDCSSPCVYKVNLVDGKPVFDIRTLRCIKCGCCCHRDRAGAMNAISNAINFDRLHENLRHPMFSEAMGNGPRLTCASPTKVLTLAVYKFEEKKGNRAAMKGEVAESITLEEYHGLIRNLEAKVQAKRKAEKGVVEAEEDGDARNGEALFGMNEDEEDWDSDEEEGDSDGEEVDSDGEERGSEEGEEDSEEGDSDSE